MSLTCDADADVSDPHTALNAIEDEILPALGVFRTGLAMEVLRGVADGLPRRETRNLLDRFLEV